jgi:hypothetical protein
MVTLLVDDEDIAKERANRHQRAAAAAGGALLGAVVGGPVGAIAGASLAPLLEPFAEKVWNELHHDAQKRQAKTLAVVQESMEIDPAELERRIMSSDESRLQTGMALSAASRTAWDPKVVALGRALARGLMATDDSKIDTHPLVMSALADIEFPHASLLELITCWRTSVTPSGGILLERYAANAGSDWIVGPRVWSSSMISLVRPNLKPVALSLFGTLQRHGLAIETDQFRTRAGIARAVNRPPDEVLKDTIKAANLAIGLRGDGDDKDWLPTELGEEVINCLLEAGGIFG